MCDDIIGWLKLHYCLIVTVEDCWKDVNALCACCEYKSRRNITIMQIPPYFDLNLLVYDGWFSWYYLGDYAFLLEVLYTTDGSRRFISAKLARNN